MNDEKFQNMSDRDLIRYLRDYALNRKGEIRALTLAAADRILDMKAKIRSLEREGDDGK